MEIRQILVGVDEHGRARPCVQQAAALAQRTGGALTLCHAVLPLAGLSVDLGVDVAASARAHLLDLYHDDLPEDWHSGQGLRVELGASAVSLVDNARALNADLMIIGPHARRRRWLGFGGTARGVLHHTPCPVWVQPGRCAEVRHILVPVDLAAEAVRVLAAARDWALLFDAKVTVATVFHHPRFTYHAGHSASLLAQAQTDQERTFHALLDSFDWRGLSWNARFVCGDPVEEILVLQREADLVVMGVHRRGALGAALLGSVAYEVIQSCLGPVVAVPPRG